MATQEVIECWEPLSGEELLAIAEQALSFGFIPIGLSGKKPILPGWTSTTKSNAMKKISDTLESIDSIGVLTGAPSGIVVVDIDTRNDGIASWKKLVSDKGLPTTFTVETGGGGLHYYFSYTHPANYFRKNIALLGSFLDLKTNGGQVVFPGSLHATTHRRYSIVDGFEGEPILAKMPSWLFTYIANKSEK